METNLLLTGVALIILGGMMEGGYALPLKYTPKWNWENTWGAASLMALLLIPWPVAALTIPHLLEVYKGSPTSSILLALIFGAGWGVGGLFFGLGIKAVGLSLGLSLIMGLIAINGSLLPLIMEHPEQFSQRSGLMVIVGIGVMAFGLVLVALAGHRKDLLLRQASSAEMAARHEKSAFNFKVGLLLCLASGVLSALVNFALIFGQEVTQQAITYGADPAHSNNAVWGLVFTSNYLVNIGYCVYLNVRNNSTQKFTDHGTGWYWMAVAVMGAVWAGGIVLYGMGAFQLGQFGAYLGFPILLITAILTGNVLGFLTGEWKGADKQTHGIMAGGVAVLILAIVVFAYANSLMT